MLTAKILFNSVISTPGARSMTLDISNFYLITPLKRPEYLCMKLHDIPAEIIQEYKLKSLVKPDGSVYILVSSACMDYRKQASWQTNPSKNASMHMGTSKVSSSLVSGGTNSDPSSFP
ncbi:hypothetical protein ACHAW6_000681 [Cyclotella cf. meneghiniana]